MFLRARVPEQSNYLPVPTGAGRRDMKTDLGRGLEGGGGFNKALVSVTDDVSERRR